MGSRGKVAVTGSRAKVAAMGSRAKVAPNSTAPATSLRRRGRRPRRKRSRKPGVANRVAPSPNSRKAREVANLRIATAVDGTTRRPRRASMRKAMNDTGRKTSRGARRGVPRARVPPPPAPPSPAPRRKPRPLRRRQLPCPRRLPPPQRLSRRVRRRKLRRRRPPRRHPRHRSKAELAPWLPHAPTTADDELLAHATTPRGGVPDPMRRAAASRPPSEHPPKSRQRGGGRSGEQGRGGRRALRDRIRPRTRVACRWSPRSPRSPTWCRCR